MAEKKKRKRIRCKISELPEGMKDIVDNMLADTQNTYIEISEFLKAKGFDISKSSVGRYAARTNSAMQRLIEAQEQAKALVEVIKKNPDSDYTEGAIQIATGELTKRISAAQEEWDELPLDKALRSLDRFSRTKAYKEKVKVDISKKVKIALEEFKKEAYAELALIDPNVYQRLIEIANRVEERILSDDE